MVKSQLTLLPLVPHICGISMVSCQKGPTRHAYAWQIGPFCQDTLDIWYASVNWVGKSFMIKLPEIGATHHADGSADGTTRNWAHQREDIWTKGLRFAHCTHVTHCPQLTPGKWNGDGRHGPETTSFKMVGAHIAPHACHAPPLKAVLSCCTTTDPGHAGLISAHACFAHCTHFTHYARADPGFEVRGGANGLENLKTGVPKKVKYIDIRNTYIHIHKYKSYMKTTISW